MDHTSRNSVLLAHQSRRNHDLSPLRAIRPGSRNRLAPAAGVATVLAIAGLGILLAFTGPRNPLRKSAPEFDQENALFDGSRTPSHSPWPAPVSSPSPTPTPTSPADGFLDLITPSTPGPNVPSTPDPNVPKAPESTPALSRPAPSRTTTPGWVRVLPAPTRKAASPRPSRSPTARAATPAARTSPAVTPAPEPPAPENRATEPRATEPRAPEPRATVRVGPNPCATFQDLRQDYCYRLLEGLSR